MGYLDSINNTGGTVGFVGIGDAKQWTSVDYAAKRIRLKLMNTSIRLVRDLNKEVASEVRQHDLNRVDLLKKLKNQLLMEYSQSQRDAINTRALERALNH
jgi:hypothetical protein